MLKFTIKNQEGYLALCKRVEQGVVYLEGKWQDPMFERARQGYMAMAMAMAEWEMSTGLFDINFKKWELENYQSSQSAYIPQKKYRDRENG